MEWCQMYRAREPYRTLDTQCTHTGLVRYLYANMSFFFIYIYQINVTRRINYSRSSHSIHPVLCVDSIHAIAHDGRTSYLAFGHGASVIRTLGSEQ